MFELLMEKIRYRFGQLPDLRKPSNRTTYTVSDAALSAFSVFFMQAPSFLAYQRQLQRRKGRDNAQKLFGVHEIPSDNQLRNILDPLAPSHLGEAFWDVYEALGQAELLKEHVGIDQNLLCGLDGTQYFSSQALQCANCTQKQTGEKTTYSHSVIAPVLVAPDHDYVISLAPEFVTPQDGCEKQDCEQKAIKRWVEQHAHRFPPDQVTILADDLHCHQPLCELLRKHHFNFILVCKPDSHPTLYEEIALLDKVQAVTHLATESWNGRFRERWSYRYVNHVPLRAGADALAVNWCELTIVHSQTGELLYRNAFATNHLITDGRVADIVRSGRARWKTENENHNILKNHGYHLAHNFGHGHAYLAAFLLALNLLAFLMHTSLQLTDVLYQCLRHELGPRKTFFHDLLTLTRYFVFDSWHQLLTFMSTQLELEASP
jgi:hypothetical protein